MIVTDIANFKHLFSVLKIFDFHLPSFVGKISRILPGLRVAEEFGIWRFTIIN